MDEADVPVSRGPFPRNPNLPPLEVGKIVQDIYTGLYGATDALQALEGVPGTLDTAGALAGLSFVAQAAAEAHRAAARRFDDLAAEAARRLDPGF